MNLDAFSILFIGLSRLPEPDKRCRNRRCKRPIYRAGYCHDCRTAWENTCQVAQEAAERAKYEIDW